MPNKNLRFTDLDYLVGEPQLQMMKAALPYMQQSQQKMLSLAIKVMEVQKTAQLFHNGNSEVLTACAADAPKATPAEILEAIKPYGGTAEQEFLDVAINIMKGFQIHQKYQDSVEGPPPPSPRTFFSSNKIPFDQLKNILPAKQQERLETIQMMMQAMEAFT